jgi:hypothetical protein
MKMQSFEHEQAIDYANSLNCATEDEYMAAIADYISECDYSRGI